VYDGINHKNHDELQQDTNNPISILLRFDGPRSYPMKGYGK
jgi:hypothetical protein